jgi:hypothetical protein
MKFEWTPEKVRDELPDVRLHEKWVVVGTITWDTLARVLNEDSEVLL